MNHINQDDLVNIGTSELPLSPVFIDFVARWLDARGFADERWFDQISETLSNPMAALFLRQKVRERDHRSEKIDQKCLRRWIFQRGAWAEHRIHRHDPTPHRQLYFYL
jgi:hypothetical protein